MGKLITTLEMGNFLIFTILMALTHQTISTVDGQTPWAKTVHQGKERTTVLQFYWHDVLSGNSPTAVQVVPPRKPGSANPFTGFGFIRMCDDPMTVGPDPKSKLVGRAQGIYGRASKEDYTLIMDLTYTFLDGIYNGSSLSVLARNSIPETVREFPVVGGTGFFRMARGYAMVRTYSLNVTSRDAIVGYNVTLFH